MIASFLEEAASQCLVQQTMSWLDFVSTVTCHDIVMRDTHLHEVKCRQRAFIASEFFDSQSKNLRNCKAVHALVIDIDSHAEKLFRALQTGTRLFRHRYAAYSSMNHLVDGKTPKLRIVIPYDRPISPEQHRALATEFCAAFARKWGCEVDETSFNPVQCFTYGVRNIASKPFVATQSDCAPLEVGKLLMNIKTRKEAATPKRDSTEDGFTQREIAEQLSFIAATRIGHEDRQRVLKAIYATLGDAGRALAESWYHKKGDEFEEQWNSSRAVRQITAGTIYHLAVQNGYAPAKLRLAGKGEVEEYAKVSMTDVPDNPRAKAIKKLLGHNYGYTAQKIGMGEDDFDLEALKAHGKQLLHPDQSRLLDYVGTRSKRKFCKWFHAYREARLDTVRISPSLITYLPSHIFQEEVEVQAWASQHGSGKTREIGQQVLDWARLQGLPIIFINDRQIATAKIAERLGVPCYDRVKKWRNKSKWKTLSEVAICVNSLAHPAFKSILARNPVVVIDEVAQVLSAFQFGLFGELGSAKVDEVFKAFVIAICNAPRLLVMDANLTVFHLEMLKRLMSYDHDIPVYARNLQPLKLNVEYGYDHGAQKKFKGEALRRLIQGVDNGIKAMVPVEGRRAVSELKLTLERHFDSHRAKRLGITGEPGVMGTRRASNAIDLRPKIVAITSQRSREREKLLTEDVRDFFADHDAFLHTASVSSCVSNEVKEYTLAVAWFPGHLLTPTEMVQMLFRGRNVTNAVLALNTQYANRTLDFRPHSYSRSGGWSVRLHQEISHMLHEHRKSEQEDSLRTLLWFLEERGAFLSEMQVHGSENYGRMLAEGREEFMDHVLSARYISDLEYSEDRARVFTGDVSVFTDAEEQAYCIRSKFCLRKEDELTRGHVLLEASQPDIDSVIDRTAAFLYDGPWKGLGRGAPPRDIDALLHMLRPMRALKSSMSSETIKSISTSIFKGEWQVADAHEVIMAIMKNRKTLMENMSLSTLVPKELREKAHNATLSREEQTLIVQTFRSAFGLHIRNKHASLISEAAKRRQAAFPDVEE